MNGQVNLSKAALRAQQRRSQTTELIAPVPEQPLYANKDVLKNVISRIERKDKDAPYLMR
jgi:hypothetical protein